MPSYMQNRELRELEKLEKLRGSNRGAGSSSEKVGRQR